MKNKKQKELEDELIYDNLCRWDEKDEYFKGWVGFAFNNIQTLLRKYIGIPDIGKGIKVKITVNKGKIIIEKVKNEM